MKRLMHLPMSSKKELRRLSEEVMNQLQNDEMFAVRIALDTQTLLEKSKDFAPVDTSYQSKLYSRTFKLPFPSKKNPRVGVKFCFHVIRLIYQMQRS